MSVRRPFLLPIVPLYGLGAAIAELLRPPVRRLARPVVSVGSLSSGGAGKTPVVKMLGELLRGHGVAADVLSRGYGRAGAACERVDPAGTAVRFGDEPLELARAGLPVFVGADRYAAGLLAEREHDALLHLLDDGFQHRQLARDLNVVLLTEADAHDRLLPAGNLREPIAAIGRAEVVVLRDDEAEGLATLVRAQTAAEIWIVRRELHWPSPPSARPFAFCGLARPESFFANLPGSLAGRTRFPDHHRYQPREVERLARAARRAQADGFVTTAKDMVKLTGELLAVLQAVGPVVVGELRVVPLDPEAVWTRLLRVLA